MELNGFERWALTDHLGSWLNTMFRSDEENDRMRVRKRMIDYCLAHRSEIESATWPEIFRRSAN